jgi:D-serine dehydratase
MQKLKRNINMGFRVNEDEKYFIDKKMEAAGWTNFRGFVLHCLVRGQIVRLNLDEIREMNMLLRNVSNNINQIAARANSTNRVYENDINDIQSRQRELWEQQNKVLGKLSAIADGELEVRGDII